MYDRKKAIEYAFEWWNKRNPNFYNFDTIGGDCTNFVSQCLFYGGIEMNFSYLGWYYNNLNSRSPSWAGVNEFYSFATTNFSNWGVRAKQVNIQKTEPGDVVQIMQVGETQFHHTLLITKIDAKDEKQKDYNNIFLTGHTHDVLNVPINHFAIKEIRFLKILN